MEKKKTKVIKKPTMVWFDHPEKSPELGEEIVAAYGEKGKKEIIEWKIKYTGSQLKFKWIRLPKILPILILFLASLLACSKGGDYGYLNTDRRPQVIIISQRYTNPPVIENGNWKPYKIVYDSLSRDIDYRSYEGLKPDTLISSCSIDKVDSLFKIEIRKYKIN